MSGDTTAISDSPTGKAYLDSAKLYTTMEHLAASTSPGVWTCSPASFGRVLYYDHYLLFTFDCPGQNSALGRDELSS